MDVTDFTFETKTPPEAAACPTDPQGLIPYVVLDSLEVSEVSDFRPYVTVGHSNAFVVHTDGEQSLRSLTKDSPQRGLTGYFFPDQLKIFNRVQGTNWSLDAVLPASETLLVNSTSHGVFRFQNTVDLNSSTAPQISIQSENGNLFDLSTEVIALYSNVQIGYNDTPRNVIVRVYSEMQDYHDPFGPILLDHDSKTCHNNKLYTYVEIYIEDEAGEDLTMDDCRRYTLGYKGTLSQTSYPEETKVTDEMVEDLLKRVKPQVGTLENGDRIAYSRSAEFEASKDDVLFLGGGIFIPSVEAPVLPEAQSRY